MESLRKPLFISCFFCAIVKRGQCEFSDPPGVCISLRRRSSWKRTAVISRITISSIQESVLVIGTHTWTIPSKIHSLSENKHPFGLWCCKTVSSLSFALADVSRDLETLKEGRPCWMQISSTRRHVLILWCTPCFLLTVMKVHDCSPGGNPRSTCAVFSVYLTVKSHGCPAGVGI